MNIAGLIDHTILKADATSADIKKLAEEAVKYGFASVCVNPYRVREAADLLKNSTVKVCTVIGFPLGASTSEIKAAEAIDAIKNGATEIDMVVNIGAIKDNDYTTVESDIKAVKNAISKKAILKVIIETCLLTDEQKVQTSLIAVKAGADFVKTSTGFSTGGATLHDIQLIKKTIGDKAGIKASGGIRNIQEAMQMVKAGATRIGTSSGVKFLEGKESKGY